MTIGKLIKVYLQAYKEGKELICITQVINDLRQCLPTPKE